MWENSTAFVAHFPDAEQYSNVLRDLASRLRDAKFAVQTNETSLLITAPDVLYYEEAERQQLMKPLKNSGILDEFTVNDKESFVDWNEENFFVPAELAHMLHELLDNVTPDNTFIKELEKSLSRKVKHEEHESVFQVLTRIEIMEELQLKHDKAKQTKLWNKIVLSIYKMPVQSIRDYYGESVAFYFGWMNFYTFWLIPAAVVGATLSFVRPADVTIDNAPYIPFFALFMVLWGFLFIKIWKRKTAEFAFQWDTHDRVRKETYRPSFYGKWRKSEITDEMELHYPTSIRRMKYLVSFLVTLVMLCIAFVVMICSLNLQGYVSCHNRLGGSNPFHVEALHKFSEPGAIFDPNGNAILALVPVVIHAVVIMILNQMIYSRIAKALTDWENHKTDAEYENSLILKRFLFEAFDCYISLFYLAFYELDIMRLRSELMALYTSDCIRRVLTETIIPLVVQKLRKRKNKASEEAEAVDSDKEEIELFDDYLEMVIQYGYITLFASAFPFAAALSFVSNVIEMKSDGFKMSFLFKRPIVRRVRNIGTWQTVLVVQTWIAVLTNVFLFGFSSEQMLQWFPWLFDHISVVVDGVSIVEQQLRMGAGRYVMGLVFSLEHALLLLGLAITFLIDDVPEWVRVAIARREYFQAKEIKALRSVSKKQTSNIQSLNLTKKVQ